MSARLSRIASYISGSPAPSLSVVASRLAAILMATDRTLSEAIGKRLADQVSKLMPSEFDGSTYDTSDRGKGFKDGYISWGMKPTTWEAADLIGGILFKGTYDPEEFSSEAPEDGAEWTGHSKGEAAVTLNVEAGYYNKRFAGGVQETIPLGTCTVLLDAKEQIMEAEIDDPSAFKDGVMGLVQKISSSPPDEALSEGRKRKNLPPTASPAALMKWLNQNNRTEVNRSEINALVKNISEGTGRAPGTVLEEVNNFFRKRMTIDERS